MCGCNRKNVGRTAGKGEAQCDGQMTMQNLIPMNFA